MFSIIPSLNNYLLSTYKVSSIGCQVLGITYRSTQGNTHSFIGEIHSLVEKDNYVVGNNNKLVYYNINQDSGLNRGQVLGKYT